jgi:hypothetical protein
MHLDEGTIHAWLDGALDAEEAARVERHAADCAACAAAVAEARGLVAGASRILTALDSVPGAIVPKTAASTTAPRARRTRSLWSSLHLTPARAAAAAVVVIAAGTALVLRSAPNAARSPITLAEYPHDSAVTMKPAAPVVLPLAAPDTAASQTIAAPRPAARPSRTLATKAAPKPAGASARRGVVGEGAMERSAAVATAEEAKQSVATTDNAVRGAVAGAASRAPAVAPPSAVAKRFDAAKVLPEPRLAAGCYLVTTDSAISLPTRLRLDSAFVAQQATLQRSRAAAADAATMERHGVSEIVNDGRRSIAGAFWSPRGDGSIRVSLPASLVEMDLRPASASTLVGTATIGGRSTSVTLRRAECGTE